MFIIALSQYELIAPYVRLYFIFLLNVLTISIIFFLDYLTKHNISISRITSLVVKGINRCYVIYFFRQLFLVILGDEKTKTCLEFLLNNIIFISIFILLGLIIYVYKKGYKEILKQFKLEKIISVFFIILFLYFFPPGLVLNYLFEKLDIYIFGVAKYYLNPIITDISQGLYDYLCYEITNIILYDWDYSFYYIGGSSQGGSSQGGRTSGFNGGTGPGGGPNNPNNGRLVTDPNHSQDRENRNRGENRKRVELEDTMSLRSEKERWLKYDNEYRKILYPFSLDFNNINTLQEIYPYPLNTLQAFARFDTFTPFEGAFLYFRYLSGNTTFYEIHNIMRILNYNNPTIMSNDWYTKRQEPSLNENIAWEGDTLLSNNIICRTFRINQVNPRHYTIPNNFSAYHMFQYLPEPLMIPGYYYKLVTNCALEYVECYYYVNGRGGISLSPNSHIRYGNNTIPLTSFVLGYWVSTGILLDLNNRIMLLPRGRTEVIARNFTSPSGGGQAIVPYGSVTEAVIQHQRFSSKRV